MTVPFYKYQGTGNDFILFNHMTGGHNPLQNPYTIQAMCHRRFGIGADGVIFLERDPLYDFKIVYYNADASQSFCGNGSRCAVHWAHHLGLIGLSTTFVAIDGHHTASLDATQVRISLNQVAGVTRYQADYFVNTGSPHYVRLVDNLADLDVDDLAKEVNTYALFQQASTNVNFVKLEPNNSISMRTYERGVNAETLSCGTGAVAAALVAAHHGYHSPIFVTTLGGMLEVSFCKEEAGFSQIYLDGPVVQVFQGQYQPECTRNTK